MLARLSSSANLWVASPHRDHRFEVWRREFFTLLGGAAAVWPLAAQAQHGERTRRIGFLRASPPPERELKTLFMDWPYKAMCEGATSLWSRSRRENIEMSNYEVKNVEPVVISNDIQVRIFTLAHGDVIPWHYHRESTDHYFVLQGALTIETRDPVNRCVLSVGERYKILPGTAHRVSNESLSECQFLLVQGVGKHDWHRAD